MLFRQARAEDTPALLEIYRRYIGTTVTFECESPDTAEFERRRRDIQRFYPYLVALDATGPLGYAYAHRLSERAAYQWSAELSVYLLPEATGRGLGGALYGALMDLLRLQGIRAVFGCVTSPNPASERLHARLGFRPAGAFRDVGFKNGVWLSVNWFQKDIAERGPDPRPPLALSRLDPALVEETLRRAVAGLS